MAKNTNPSCLALTLHFLGGVFTGGLWWVILVLRYILKK